MCMYVYVPEPELEPEPELYSDKMLEPEPEPSSNFPVPQPWKRQWISKFRAIWGKEFEKGTGKRRKCKGKGRNTKEKHTKK